jgi:hypothetical protein
MHARASLTLPIARPRARAPATTTRRRGNENSLRARRLDCAVARARPTCETTRGRTIAPRTIAGGVATTEESERENDAALMSPPVRKLLRLVADSDVGARLDAETRRTVDGMIGELETVGSDASVTPPNEDARVFGYYDVSYVSVGDKQTGNPAGGRFRSPLGKFLFKTIGLEQNLFPPNKIENRVAFTLLGCLPGEVTLEGTFAPAGETDDGRTVKASFDPPGISVAGGPKLRIGPKSSVVLSTTYLDDHVRLGKGSRGSLFVFTKKSAERAERDHRRWRVGGFAIALMLLTALGLGIFGVHQLRTTNRVLYSATVIASALTSLAMAYILRDGGIVAEDADLVDVGELTEQQRDFLNRSRADGQSKGENVFGSQC